MSIDKYELERLARYKAEQEIAKVRGRVIARDSFRRRVIDAVGAFIQERVDAFTWYNMRIIIIRIVDELFGDEY